MKSLKYIIVSLVLAIGFAAPSVNAQDAGSSARPGRGDMYAPLLKGITLTAEQQTKVDAIKADAQKQAQGLSQEERRTKGREIMTASSDKIRATLTADQQKIFDANRKEIDSRRGSGKGGDKGKGGGKPGKGGGKGGADE